MVFVVSCQFSQTLPHMRTHSCSFSHSPARADEYISTGEWQKPKILPNTGVIVVVTITIFQNIIPYKCDCSFTYPNGSAGNENQSNQNAEPMTSP